jgi:hypothetical protein
MKYIREAFKMLWEFFTAMAGILFFFLIIIGGFPLGAIMLEENKILGIVILSVTAIYWLMAFMLEIKRRVK